MLNLSFLLSFDIIGAIILLIVAYYFYKNGLGRFEKKDDMPSQPQLLRTPITKKPSKGKKLKFEPRCREIFERIFKRKFPSIRPDWLKNPITKYNLELDGYCPSLKLAFEYDGEQHSKYNKRFHKNIKEFEYQVKKDSFKTLKCKQLGIRLIRIPYFIEFDDLERYIKLKLRKENII